MPREIHPRVHGPLFLLLMCSFRHILDSIEVHNPYTHCNVMQILKGAFQGSEKLLPRVKPLAVEVYALTAVGNENKPESGQFHPHPRVTRESPDAGPLGSVAVVVPTSS